jgi:hypothetical protein
MFLPGEKYVGLRRLHDISLLTAAIQRLLYFKFLINISQTRVFKSAVASAS